MIVMQAGATVAGMQAYIDGVLATPALEPAGSGGTAINTTSANDVALGRITDSSSGRTLVGMLDDVRIYPRALNAGEVAALAAGSAAGNLKALWYHRFTGNDSPTATDWQADIDHDGFDTRLEYALGGNPTAYDYGISPVLTDGLEFVFNRRRDGIPAASYVPEISETLESWVPVGPGAVEPHPFLKEFDLVTVLLPPSGNPARFVRLRIDP